MRKGSDLLLTRAKIDQGSRVDLFREMALTNEKLGRKVDQLEKRVSHHDEVLIELVQEIRRLIESPEKKGKKSKIGFIISGESKTKL